MIHTKNSKKEPKIKDLTPIWDPWYNGGSIIRRTKWKRKSQKFQITNFDPSKRHFAMRGLEVP
jgi:hypothetical protein